MRGNGERFYLRIATEKVGLTNQRGVCLQVLVLVSDRLCRGVKFPLPHPSLVRSRGAFKECGRLYQPAGLRTD